MLMVAVESIQTMSMCYQLPSAYHYVLLPDIPDSRVPIPTMPIRAVPPEGKALPLPSGHRALRFHITASTVHLETRANVQLP